MATEAITFSTVLPMPLPLRVFIGYVVSRRRVARVSDFVEEARRLGEAGFLVLGSSGELVRELKLLTRMGLLVEEDGGFRVSEDGRKWAEEMKTRVERMATRVSGASRRAQV